MDRVLRALNRNPDLGPEQTLGAVLEAVDSYVGQADQFDDLTMLCLAYYGGEGNRTQVGTAPGKEEHYE